MYAVVAGAEHGAVARDSHAGNGYIVLGYELVRTLVLAQIPDAHIASAIAADQLALVRVDDDIVDGHAVGIVTLHAARARVPDLDGAVFGARHHPFALAMECHAGDVGGVSFEGEDGVRICRLDLVELDGVVARCGEEALVGRDAQAVDLRIGVRDGPRTNTRERLPEPTGSAKQLGVQMVFSHTELCGHSPL